MQKQEEQRQQMFSLIEAWQNSGQSQKAYCRDKNIGYHVFHYWYRIYRSGQPTNTSSPSSFVQLQIETPSPACMELIMPNGKRLLMPCSTNVQTLLTLLA